VQGHRGARGSLPENCVPGFLRALELGATTLEMDVVISRDRQVVVSHDWCLSSDLCVHPTGALISRREQYGLRIFDMEYAAILRYDCGRANPRFPDQVATPAHKPLVAEVIERAEAFAVDRGLPPVRYSIEIKMRPESDDLLHPRPQEFVRLLMEALISRKVADRTIVQSFDPRPLKLVHTSPDGLLTSFLVSRYDFLGLQADLRVLGFVPDVYSPDFRVLGGRTVSDAHRLGMKVVPWTVNERTDMDRVQELGVDGLITDYPDIARSR